MRMKDVPSARGIVEARGRNVAMQNRKAQAVYEAKLAFQISTGSQGRSSPNLIMSK